ncbi:MAG TPA: valine--tRNA ligase [Candidatus Sulfotelmatobacter sp.]|nr:valine--tRNA ligase [Candidatus Sulfotelmatobacter sp.]
MSLPKAYTASDYENDIYRLWEDSGIFVAHPDQKKERFSISMPPPNETGTLHIGHALFITLQDILVRRARQEGKDTLWLPGTDHAAIATNAIIEAKLEKEGTSKHQVGREEFLRITKEFVGDSRNKINSQLRAMGASCDWSRLRYTLDDSLNRCVNEVFTMMYKDGLIYRGHRIVNWDPKLETNVSDDEVDYIEEKGKFYTLKYGPFLIGTARPETKFGDKYVVMHPDDKRYKKYKHGEQFEAEWINGKVKATIIKDESVDPKFGTGVMTITPWHDQTDFYIAERHKLDKEQIIDLKGKLLPIAGEFAGMGIDEARPKIIEKLDKKGLLVKVDDNYMHNVAINSRGKGKIEPQIRLQWFIDVNKPVVDWKGSKRSLKQVMQNVIREGDIKLVPARFEKNYFHWVDNLRDWCISRQIWWGHRIPVWYRGEKETYVGVLPPDDEPSKPKWQQDPDTLDTWFSSALWTWSTLIDPKLAENYDLSLHDLLDRSQDYKTYHPTTVMETGWDILFFWVTRMILATTYVTGDIPFKTVYMHGLVRTEEGKKMSKSSPDTVVDPLEVIPEYGTDSLRLALVQGMTAGNDQRLGRSKIVTNRNFCNKLWNVARYIEGLGLDSSAPDVQTLADNWILKQLKSTQDLIKKDLENFHFSEAYDKLYHYIWNDLADWYIEASKISPNKSLLRYLLEKSLILAHPFAPFVTETIWQNSVSNNTLLAAQPLEEILAYNSHHAKDFETIKDIVTEARYLQKELKAPKSPLTYKHENLIKENAQMLKQLANLGSVEEDNEGHGIKLTSVNLRIWLDVDDAKAKHFIGELKLKKEEQAKLIEQLEKRLANKQYLSGAPESVVEQTKEQLSAARDRLKTLSEEIRRYT